MPGFWGRKYIDFWRTKPLKMSDLSKIKIVGQSKNVALSKSIESYCSVLDFEKETLKVKKKIVLLFLIYFIFIFIYIFIFIFNLIYFIFIFIFIFIFFLFYYFLF